MAAFSISFLNECIRTRRAPRFFVDMDSSASASLHNSNDEGKEQEEDEWDQHPNPYTSERGGYPGWGLGHSFGCEFGMLNCLLMILTLDSISKELRIYGSVFKPVVREG